MLDCASRFWISACRKACSEAAEALLVPSVDVELPVALPVAVDPAAVDPVAVDPAVVDPAVVDPAVVAPVVVDPVVVELAVLAPVVEVEAVPVALPPAVVAVVDVDGSLLELVGFSALTSAWKSCCSLVNALSPELDEDPDELVRLCSRF